jgi:hypothetical protein
MSSRCLPPRQEAEVEVGKLIEFFFHTCICTHARTTPSATENNPCAHTNSGDRSDNGAPATGKEYKAHILFLPGHEA